MSEHLQITKKDLEITYFRGTGSGGQKRNKTSNCVRIAHPDSGAVVEATKSRKQGENQREALKKLSEHPKFIAWVQTKLAVPSDFLVETRRQSPDGKWFWVPDGGALEVTEDDLRDW